jgi:hypothetical protein
VTTVAGVDPVVLGLEREAIPGDDHWPLAGRRGGGWGDDGDDDYDDDDDGSGEIHEVR